jgi:alcohol dehydrogenase (cytochrome c)
VRTGDRAAQAGGWPYNGELFNREAVHPSYRHPIKKIAYAVGTEGCFMQNGGVDTKASQPRQSSSDLYYGALTAFDAVNQK